VVCVCIVLATNLNTKIHFSSQFWQTSKKKW